MRYLKHRSALCLLFAGAYTLLAGGATLIGNPPMQTGTFADGSEITLPSCLYCTSGVNVRIGDGCVGMLGALISGRFFYNLRRKKTPEGPVFHVGHRTVTDFPDEVTLFVGLTSGAPCSRGKAPGAAIPSLESLRSPRAEAAYIRDMKVHPLEIDLSEEGNTPPPGAPAVPLNRVWDYRFRIKTKGVLLTDALVITLFTKQGSKFAELTWRR